MNRLFLALAILLPLLVVRPEPAAADDPDGYRQALRAAIADLDRGSPRVAEQLRELGPITFADGTTVHPDNAAIIAALESRPSRQRDAETGLRAVLVEVERGGQPPAAPWRGDARGRLQQVLDRPEFQPRPPPDPISAFLRDLWRTVSKTVAEVLQSLGNWLMEQLRGVLGGERADAVARPVAPVIGLLAVGGIALLAVRGIRQVMGPGVVATPASRAVPSLTAEAARAEAARLARAGNFRAAMRTLYLALLLRFDELGRLHFNRALTNREVVAMARAQGDAPLVDRLSPLVERFDRVWYGGAPCSPADYADFDRLVAQVWEPT